MKFSAEETAILLNQINILDLSPTDLEALGRRAEGWIAGLQLAAISLHRLAPEERHAFITSFAGDDRYILDYLMSEVLQQQPVARQKFLLYTSLLNELNAELTAAVTDSTPTDTQAMLQALEHENMFLIPLDNSRTWYRYHHLFADCSATGWPNFIQKVSPPFISGPVPGTQRRIDSMPPSSTAWRLQIWSKWPSTSWRKIYCVMQSQARF